MPAEWRVLVADDEPAARRGVRQLLAAYPAFQIVGECKDGAEVLEALDRLGPDLLFLDIQMPEVGGFEVIRRRTPARMPVVVFLTAYDQFALQAFEAQALDYLLKPVGEARFAAMMERVTRLLAPASPTLVVTTSRGELLVRVAEIEWIESADNYVKLWLGAEHHLVREPLAVLEEKLARHGFLRAHRRALIRMDGVKALAHRRDGGLDAVLSGGTKVPIARRRRAEITAAVRARSL
jgi:two-component system LytT family response regulator